MTCEERIDWLVDEAQSLNASMADQSEGYREYLNKLRTSPHTNHVWLPMQCTYIAYVVSSLDYVQIERLRNQVAHDMVQQACGLVKDKDFQKYEGLIQFYSGYNVALDLKDWESRVR